MIKLSCEWNFGIGSRPRERRLLRLRPGGDVRRPVAAAAVTRERAGPGVRQSILRVGVHGASLDGRARTRRGQRDTRPTGLPVVSRRSVSLSARVRLRVSLSLFLPAGAPQCFPVRLLLFCVDVMNPALKRSRVHSRRNERRIGAREGFA